MRVRRMAVDVPESGPQTDAMRVSAKGQVTIPASIRTALGIGPRAEVEVRLVGRTIQITVKPKTRGAPAQAAELRDRLRGSVVRERDIVSPTGEVWDAAR